MHERSCPRRALASGLTVLAAALAPLALLAQAPASQPAPGSGGEVLPARSPRNASYSIDARLAPDRRTIDASEVITWRNITSRPATELRFHLYWNAWRDRRSTFLREMAARGPVVRPADDFARLDITSLALRRGAGGDARVELADAAEFVAPDDRNPDDRTVMAVPLPEPVQPGESVVVEVAWTARVPRTFSRTGGVGDFFFIAQWFPKLGVLEDEGWNAHQFHASTEFFSDFGVYDVRLTVPSGWIVGATGVERERRENGDGTTTHRYYQEDVHDFAWTASPDYVERVADFESGPGRTVRLRLLLQPATADQAERHFAAARTALRYFGDWFGPYPYGHLTVVDPAWRSDAGGMEYPTLITAGTRWLVPEEVTINTPEEVTIHEAGHQWWHTVVATNEFEHAWMDEGITTYAAARALVQDFPETYLEARYFGGFVPWLFADIRLSRDTYWNRRSGYLRAAESDLPSDPSWRYHPATGPYITYNKTTLWLATLERWLGWETMQRALAAYYQRWQFRHPRPGDFFDAINEAAGRNLGWFFDQVHHRADVFDYGIQDLSSEASDGGFRTTVVIRRYGEAVFPVALTVRFADGEEIREEWSGRDRWVQRTYERPARAVSASVDPDRVLLLDVNFTNNSRTLAPQAPAAATKWALKWAVWLQDALLTWAFFA